MKVSKKSPFLGISCAQFLRVSGRLTALAWLGGLPPPRPIFFAPMDVVVEAEGGKREKHKRGEEKEKGRRGIVVARESENPTALLLSPCLSPHLPPSPPPPIFFLQGAFAQKYRLWQWGGGRRKGERVFVPLFSFGEKYVRKCLAFQKIMPFLLKMWALLTSVQLENANSFLFFSFLFLCPSLGHSCSEVSWGRRAGLLRFRVPVCIGGRRV